MKWFFRIILFFSLAFSGAVTSGAVGGLFFVPRSAGLAGGAMVLGWALLGAVLFPAVGLFLCRKLELARLRRISATIGGVAVILTVLVFVRNKQLNNTNRDPDNLYAGIPEYTLSLRQIIITDPYLSTRIDLDARQRSWASWLPDARVCRGEMPADYQRDVAAALTALASLEDSVLQSCHRTEEKAEQTLSWTLPGYPSDELKISPECRESRSEIAGIIAAVRRAGVMNKSRVRCR